MKTFHRGELTGHTAAILEQIPRWAVMVCDGSKSFNIAAKCPISSHRVAGPYAIYTWFAALG